jgi:hypothetical protein
MDLGLRDLVPALYHAFDSDDAMALIGDLCALDRYQASRGIEIAADRVAERAERAGLTGVEVLRYPADGARHWWTFRAPRSWTPTMASLELLPGGGRKPILVSRYPDEACTIATYSAPTLTQGVTAPLVEVAGDGLGLAGPIRGAVLVVPALPCPFPQLVEQAQTGNALGLVSDVASPHLHGEHADAVGRIELPLSTTLFGFSVGHVGMRRILNAARHGWSARAVVQIDRIGTMPLVTGVIPGRCPDEVLVQAHLCHPRPGANDNLSGVAAAVGAAAAISTLRRQGWEPACGIRFLWAPEFVGTAAYLHEAEAGSRWRRPRAAVNLDMVGENQARCGGPLILECAPDHVPSSLAALAERCLELLPAPRSFAGSVPAPVRNWQVTPFAGPSDHCLFADRSVAVPAVQLGHWPDRFYHSSADTLDCVDAEELRRAGVVAAATAAATSAPDAVSVAQLEFWVARSVLRRFGEIVCTAIETPPAEQGVIDPRAPGEGRGLLRHALAAGEGNLAAAQALLGRGPARASSTMLRWLRREEQEHAALLPHEAPAEPPPRIGGYLRPRWPGPFNLLGLVEDASPSDRHWLWRELGHGGQVYATMVALALALDGASDREAAARRAAFSSGLAVGRDFADRFLDVLIETGWAEEEDGRPHHQQTGASQTGG